MSEAIQEFEEEQIAQEERVQFELRELKKFVQDQIRDMRETLDDQIGIMKKRTNEKLGMQDDLIDQLTCELHKEQKKKSDVQMDIKDLRDRAELMAKKMQF